MDRCINCAYLVDDGDIPVCDHYLMRWNGRQIRILNKWDMSCANYFPIPVEAECKHEHQSSSSGGWYCLNCGAMWNPAGKQVK